MRLEVMSRSVYNENFCMELDFGEDIKRKTDNAVDAYVIAQIPPARRSSSLIKPKAHRNEKDNGRLCPNYFQYLSQPDFGSQEFPGPLIKGRITHNQVNCETLRTSEKILPLPYFPRVRLRSTPGKGSQQRL